MPRSIRLTLTCLVALAVGVAIVRAGTGPSDQDDPAQVPIGAAVTEPAASASSPGDGEEYIADEVDGDGGPEADRPAPAGAAPGVWWRPGRGDTSPSLVWVFNPATNSGYQREYQPTGIDGSLRSQRLFTYDPTETGVRVSFLSVTSANPHDEDLTSLDYDSSDGVLRVNRDGSTESWFGCSSSEMPAVAVVLC